MRQPGALLVQPFPQRTTRGGFGQDTGFDLDAGFGQPQRPARGLRIWVCDGVGDSRNLGRDKGIHARRGPAVVVARLQRHHRGAADRTLPRPAQCHHLRVGAAGRLGCADARDLTVAVQNDRPHRRIGIRAAFDPVGLLDG